ncbi:hypothetical protein [Azospirillum sp. B510]|uniref:hypothetical protein n=1 Tax=Azospirillum sp. (strain B510) TaxID=137722 RepID=UPI0002FDBE52|nr:hypothetical protein [Azospirillum sp. B510]
MDDHDTRHLDARRPRPPENPPEPPSDRAGPTIADTGSGTRTAGAAEPILERLDRLSDLLMRRIDRLEERVRGLEQDNGEIINLLIAVKAGLEEASGDLIAQLEEADDGTGPEDGSEAGSDAGSEDGPLFGLPCGPTMLH